MSTNDSIIVQQAFDGYKESLYEENVDESTFFEVFAIDNILKDYDLSYSDIFDGITDGGADGGIDAAYMFVNGELVSEDTDLLHFRKDISLELIFFQVKCTSSFKQDAIDKISSSFRDLFDLRKKDLSELQSVYNEKILDKFDLIRSTYRKLSNKFPSLDIKIYYVTNSPERPHENVSRKAEILQKDIKEKYFSESTVNFKFTDAATLLESIRKNQKTTLALKYVGTPLISPFGEAYVCLVNIKDFVAFVGDDNGKLKKINI